MKKIAILQSNYIPWKGYFDMIGCVDEFILYDDVQYTRSDWRNRNKIKTKNGLLWLTIPIGRHYKKINETTVSDRNWGKKHWSAILHNYSKTPFFKDYKDIFEDFYLSGNKQFLSQINYQLIKIITGILDIDTKISFSTDYKLTEGKTERLVNLVQQAGGNEYISGPSAQNYIIDDFFKQANIKLTYMVYNNYPEYPQLFPPFEHYVSVIDLIFNAGPEARNYLKYMHERTDNPKLILPK